MCVKCSIKNVLHAWQIVLCGGSFIVTILAEFNWRFSSLQALLHKPILDCFIFIKINSSKLLLETFEKSKNFIRNILKLKNLSKNLIHFLKKAYSTGSADPLLTLRHCCCQILSDDSKKGFQNRLLWSLFFPKDH